MALISEKWKTFGLRDESEMMQDFLQLEERNREQGKTNKSLDLRMGMLRIELSVYHHQTERMSGDIRELKKQNERQVKEIGVHKRAAVNRRGELDTLNRLNTDYIIANGKQRERDLLEKIEEQENRREEIDDLRQKNEALETNIRRGVFTIPPGFEAIRSSEVEELRKYNADLLEKNTRQAESIRQGIRVAENLRLHQTAKCSTCGAWISNSAGACPYCELIELKDEYSNYRHRCQQRCGGLDKECRPSHGFIKCASCEHWIDGTEGMCPFCELEALRSKIEELEEEDAKLQGLINVSGSAHHEHRARLNGIENRVNDVVSKADIAVSDFEALEEQIAGLKRRYELHKHLMTSQGNVDR